MADYLVVLRVVQKVFQMAEMKDKWKERMKGLHLEKMMVNY